MKKKYVGIALSALLASCQTVPPTPDYAVIASQDVVADSTWNQVAQVLKDKHQASLLTYQKHLSEVLPQLQQLHPRYVAIVEKPEHIGRDYVIALNRMSRQVDSDIYADFLWGIITGYDAAAALKMVNNSTEPLVIKDAVATITELKSAKWFDRYGWIDDHTIGLWGEKTSRTDTVVTHQLPSKKVKIPYTFSHGNTKMVERVMVDPQAEMQTFYDLYEKYNPDLVVTAAHASERNLEMPFSLGNIKPKEGQLYMDFKDNPQFLKESGKRKVYLPIGNCLIANMNNTRESMAAAWMNSANAATMVGYVVTTWHGRNGWGGLKYLVTTPGRYSVAEAFYLNQQDFLHQLNEWDPKFTTLTYPSFEEKEMEQAQQILKDSLGLEEPTHDQIGFFHDRDVLAYYGDPKWDVRLQEIPEENDFTVTMQQQGKRCTLTITTKENFSLARMKGDQFKQEHVLDLPFSYFFPERLNHPRLAAGQDWKVALDENFLLIYNADFEPGKTYAVELEVD